MPWTSKRRAPWVPASKVAHAIGGRPSPPAAGAPASRGSRRAPRRGPGPSAEPGRPTPSSGPTAPPSAARRPSAAHADEVAHRVGLVVGRVVEDLLAPDRLDRAGQPGQRIGRTSLPQPGSMPDTKRAPPPSAAASTAVAQRGRRAALVVERVDRRGDDDGAGTEGAGDVGRRVVAGERRQEASATARGSAPSTASTSSVVGTPGRRGETRQPRRRQ